MAAAVLSSPQLESHQEKATDDAVEKLKAHLIRYTRANDRRMVLRSLKDVEFLFKFTLGKPTLPPDICLSELEQELVEETVVMNDYTFKPLSTVERKDTFTNAGTNSGCLVIMKGLAEGLCDENNISSADHGQLMDGKALYEKLVARLARTSASVDIFDRLNALLGSPDLVVKHIVPGQVKVPTTPGIVISKSNSYGSSSSDNTNEDKSIHVNLYESNGDVHMVLDMTLEFGLFRKSDANMSRPWIALKAFLHERANLSSGENYRVVSVKTPSLY